MTWPLVVCLLPAFAGSVLAAYHHGFARGIEHCRGLRTTLHPHRDAVTGELVWKPTPPTKEAP